MTNELICYKTNAGLDKDKLPKMFQKKHNTKSGCLAKGYSIER